MTGADCGCLTHDGPHWRHMDALWAARNRALLERARTMVVRTPEDYWRCYLALLAFAQVEQRRLADKEAELAREEARR